MSIQPPDDTPKASPDLPELTAGLHVLDATPEAGQALHALTVDHVLLAGGEACWIDPGSRARTAPLVAVAPSDRILDRVRVARGFTAFQHLALLESLPELLTDRTEVVVVPDVDMYYRDDDLLADEGRDMLLTGVASLARVARRADIPVVLTRRDADAFSAPVSNAADRVIRCDATPMGPRFSTDGDGSADTLIYPVSKTRYVQTTLAFWERVLTARHSQTGTAQEVTVHGAD